MDRGLMSLIVLFYVTLNCVCGMKYLMTFVGSENSTIELVSGQQGVSYVTIYPPSRVPIRLDGPALPYFVTSHTVTLDMIIDKDIENKSVIADDQEHSLNLHVRDTFFGYSPLPIDALGNRYVFSACHSKSSNKSTVLVIASHSKRSNVDLTFSVGFEGNVTFNGITYDSEDTLFVSLLEYQTLIIESEYSLSGSVILASETVAVYSGTRKNGLISAYTQLLPVTQLGKEYLLAVDDNSVGYTMQFTPVYNDTRIRINHGFTITTSGTFTIGFVPNGIMFATSSQPILILLCRGEAVSDSGFAVLPSVSLYQSDTVLPLNGQTLKILAINKTDSFDVRSSSELRVSIQWTSIEATSYHIGTLKVPLILNSSMEISSSGSFSVFSLSETFIQNGGYKFLFEDILTTVDHPKDTTTRRTSMTTMTKILTPFEGTN